MYEELVLNVRKLFHQCKLVHADLSEYNILYHEGHLYIIDVSQSVEHDHPSAFDFLRSDIKNVEDFFGKMGVRCLGIRRCFEFVISERLGSGSGQQQQDEDPATVLKKWLNEELSESPAGEGELGPGTTPTGADAASATSNVPPSGSNKAHEDSVFMQSYIPRSLNEVYDPERDVDAVLRGEGKQLIYADSIGLVDTSSSAPAAVSSSDSRPDGEKKTSRVRFGGDVPGGSDESEESSEGEGGEEEDEEGEEDSGSEDGDETKPFEERRPRGHRHEDREEKKVRNLIYLLHTHTLKQAY